MHWDHVYQAVVNRYTTISRMSHAKWHTGEETSMPIGFHPKHVHIFMLILYMFNAQYFNTSAQCVS